MSKKLILDFEEEQQYSMIGISSGLKDYRLMFYLNKLAGFNFSRAMPFVFTVKETVLQFSLYVYIDIQNMRNYYLISNKANAVKLIKEFKHFDYLLVMDGEMEDDFTANLAKQIKTVNGVMLASVADDIYLDKIPNLRMSFDMHIDKVLKEF